MPKLDYVTWKRAVDAALLAICGMRSDDLPDYGYRAAYASGKRPSVVARAALKAAQDF